MGCGLKEPAFVVEKSRNRAMEKGKDFMMTPVQCIIFSRKERKDIGMFVQIAASVSKKEMWQKRNRR